MAASPPAVPPLTSSQRQTRQQKQRQQKPAAVAASGASGAAASLTCDVCGRGFSRPSHYDRHYRTHLPPEGRLALPCARCGKVFGRNDVLLRHLRTAHGVDPGPQPRAAQKSCYRCVQLRRKCDRAQPCRLCAAVGALCQYAAGASRKDVQQPPQQPQPQPLPPSQTDPSPASHTSPPVLAYAPVHLSRDDVQHDASPPFAPVPPLFHGGVHPAVATYPHHAEYDTGIPPSTDSQPPFLPGGSPAFSDDYYLAATDASAFVPSSLSTVCQLDFRTAGLDWLDFDVPDFFSADDSSIGLEMDPALGAAPPPSAPQLLAAEPAPSQPQPQAHAQAPAERPSSAMVPDGGPSPILPWPFDDTPHDATQHEAAPRRFSLPPLREVLQNTLMQSTDPAPPHRSVLANLVVLMSDPRLPAALEEGEGTGGSVDATASAEAAAAAAAAVTSTPGMAHAANLLKRLVDTYVAKFQPILPLLHVPTWDLATCPPVLVSAMACVGSMLSEDARLASLTCSISDICLPMIAWLGSSDSANYRDIGYLSALCVHQIYSLGSGNRQLYQNADRSRGILVGGLRGMGCLTTARLNLDEDETPPSSSHTPFPVSLASSSASTSGITSPKDPLHAQWLAWIARERETRTAWSSFEYDCSLCTLTGRRGAVDLSELPSRLPCAETLWDAPSATAWAALRTRLHADALGVSVARVLKEALQDPACTAAAASTASPPTPAVSFWGRRLCAQVVGRLLWDLKQLETLSTAAYFGMPSLSTAQAANKARLLRALDNLLLSMDQPTTVGDLISYK